MVIYIYSIVFQFNDEFWFIYELILFGRGKVNGLVFIMLGTTATCLTIITVRVIGAISDRGYK